MIELVRQREVQRRPGWIEHLPLEGGPPCARRDRGQQHHERQEGDTPTRDHPAGRDSTMGCAMIQRLAVVYPTISTSITSWLRTTAR